MANKRRRNTILPLERGLGILEQLSTAGRPLGIADLSRRLGLSKGSAARFVATLVRRNYVFRYPETAKPPAPKKMAATTGARGRRTRVPISN